MNKHFSVHEHTDLFQRVVVNNVSVQRPVTVVEDHHHHLLHKQYHKRSYYSHAVLHSDLFQRWNVTNLQVTRAAPAMYFDEHVELLQR